MRRVALPKVRKKLLRNFKARDVANIPGSIRMAVIKCLRRHLTTQLSYRVCVVFSSEKRINPLWLRYLDRTPKLIELFLQN
jgi:hypothetical protein